MFDNFPSIFFTMRLISLSIFVERIYYPLFNWRRKYIGEISIIIFSWRRKNITFTFLIFEREAKNRTRNSSMKEVHFFFPSSQGTYIAPTNKIVGYTKKN